MKVFVILCLSFIFCPSFTQGRFLEDIVVPIHETVQHIREDIKNVIHHRDKNHSKDDVPNTNVKPATEPVTDNGITIQTLNTDIVIPDSVAKTEAGKPEPTVTKLPTTTLPSTATTNKIKDEQGRANLKGSCATGYYKTEYGTCEEIYTALTK